MKNTKQKMSLRQKYFLFKLFRRDVFKYIIKLMYLNQRKHINDKLNSNEIKILSIIRQLTKDDSTDIVQSTYGYLVSNEKLHVDCLITNKNVIFTNTVISTDKTYNSYLIYKLKLICQNRLIIKCNTRVESMLERETQIFTNIKKQLQNGI